MFKETIAGHGYSFRQDQELHRSAPCLNNGSSQTDIEKAIESDEKAHASMPPEFSCQTWFSQTFTDPES
jgi:hypothetical protein